MRLRDLVADLQAELQQGVDRATSELADEGTGTRFAVRSVDVDLPVGVAEREDEAASEDGDKDHRLDIRPGGGDGRLTFSFVPGGRSGQADRRPAGSQDIGGGFDLGAELDIGRAFDVDDDTETGEMTGPTDGPIIPEASGERPAVRFDPSVPVSLRAGTEHPVDAVEGIGPKRAEALEGMGVTTVAELAAADPSEVAAELATADAQGRRLVARARFMDLGADEQSAEALVDQGVAVDELPELDPEQLRAQIQAAVASEDTPVPEGYEPDPATIDRLVERGRERRR